MSDYNVYLKCPDYLAQWITHTFGNPVELIKDSPEMRILNELTVKKPHHREADTGEDANITIPIPYFKGKDPQYWNYMHESGKKALIESFSSLFKKDLINEITALDNMHVKRKTLIYAFMEKRAIDETHWDTIAQIYHRASQKYKLNKGVKLR